MIEDLKNVWNKFILPFFSEIANIFLNILKGINSLIVKKIDFRWDWGDTFYLVILLAAICGIGAIYQVILRGEIKNEYYIEYSTNYSEPKYFVKQVVDWRKDIIVSSSSTYDDAISNLNKIKESSYEK